MWAAVKKRRPRKTGGRLCGHDRRAMPKTPSEERSNPDTKKGQLSRKDWLLAARDQLTKEGIEGLKIDKLAKKMEVTRGSFYWHFESRDELLRALIQHWEDVNNIPLLAAIEAAAANGERADFGRIIGDLWLDETRYSSAFDSAIRSWAKRDKQVARVVHRVDDTRIDAFRKMFEAYGYDGDRALIRARIVYFHQVGYYALQMRESVEERRRLGPLYDEILLD
jgi:AcrR family transcriptional regulator